MFDFKAFQLAVFFVLLLKNFFMVSSEFDFDGINSFNDDERPSKISDLISNSSRDGIEIPRIKVQTACDMKKEPQLINYKKFGYIYSPKMFDDFASNTKTNSSLFRCSWLIETDLEKTIKSKFLGFKFSYLNTVMLSDDKTETALAIFNQMSLPSQLLLEFQTQSNRLSIVFSGPELKKANSDWFVIYFEQSDRLIRECKGGTMLCRNLIKCFTFEQKCNGIDDCQDGTDEENCQQQNENLIFEKPCGHSSVPLNLRIVGGGPSQPGWWPWMVSLRWYPREPYGHTCGGSILNRRWVLTAAHCFVSYSNISLWRIHANKYQKLVKDEKEVLRYIKRIVIHPNYTGQVDSENSTWYESNVNDIALIELNALLPDDQHLITSICLPSTEVIKNQLAYVIGWGETYNTGNDLVLKQTIVPIVSREKCQEWMPQYQVGPKMLCAAYEHGGEDSCQGDSGGPLMVYVSKHLSFEIVGIVSSGGDVCAGERQAGIYTEVKPFLSWINKTTEGIQPPVSANFCELP